VLRLWVDACRPQPPHVDDLIRFNDAIDRVLAESVCFFSEQVEKSRNLLLGTLGHDMRSPLQTIQMTALRLTALNAGGPVSAAAARLIRSGARIRQLLDDLVDFNRGELAAGMQIEASEIDLASLCAEELDQLRAAYPHHQLNLEAAGDTRGVWDGARMQRVLDNLVTNAVSYGAPGAPVKVAVSGEAADVRLDVTNTGPVIDAALLERIFEPLQRGAQRRKTGNFGLGLYVVREITRAHGGTVSGRSDASGTTFTVRLPRRDAAVAVHA